MAIHKVKGEFKCVCEDCGDELFGGCTDDFIEFVEYIKEEGWRIKKDGADWIHICPTCAEGT